MTVADGLMIAGDLVAPFFAVFAQRAIETWREKRGRRLSVFKSLMATRGAALSLQHVQALNMIELEFTKPGDEAIRRAWRSYHDHLNSYPENTDESLHAGEV